ncbi:methyl-accepting chemotaxis protein [Amphibacillus jilinensis]|uniref:methyl-accepting chemotaxis protein n=1 Tax=Amphibacillus jilinensis TaxID=1216008 RepID=UPI0002EAC86C|nr:HAMP domain-containing methyl-accepting chemotaxis protein [Amphibacillus jilinensis]
MIKPFRKKKIPKTIGLKKKKNITKERRLKGSHLHNISIGGKYGLAILIIFILLMVSTTMVAISIMQSQSDMRVLQEQGDRALLTNELSSEINAKALAALSYVQFGNETHLNDFEERKERVNDLLEHLDEGINGEQQETLFNEVVDHNQKLDEMFDEELMPIIGSPETTVRLYVNRYTSLTSTTSLYFEYLREHIINDRDDAVVNAEQSQNFALIILISSMLVSFSIGGVLVILISRHVSKHLKSVVTISDRIATGDLNVESIDYQGKDEIGRLSSSINQMRTQLITMINQIKQTSQLVDRQSEQLYQSSDDVKSGTEQIAATMEELASGTESQANHAGNLAETMRVFAEKMTALHTSSETINVSSDQVLTETDLGNTAMTKSIKQMSSIDQIVKNAVGRVEGLDQQTKQISKLIAVIKDIADQTNLLALNAAIEAARAGEQGLGFAVVADEVRKLAEQVSESVTDITNIVMTIQSESKEVTGTLKQGYEEVAKGTVDIEATGERFKAIEQAISNMTSHVDTVISGLSQLADDTEQVNGSVQEIASISEQSAAGVEQTSASVEEASSAIEEISEGANTLRQSSKKLNDLVEEFNL